eukprot:1265994-Prymnesium_polylepis.1
MHGDLWRMDGPRVATRIAQKRQRLEHMRAHSRGLVRDATLKSQNATCALGCKQRLKKRRTFSY